MKAIRSSFKHAATPLPAELQAFYNLSVMEPAMVDPSRIESLPDAQAFLY